MGAIWVSVVVVVMLGGLAFWMYGESRELTRLYDQQENRWVSIDQLFRYRLEGMLDIRAVIKKEAPYETAIINELAHAQAIMEDAQNRRMYIEAYNETELSRASLPVFLYNIERLNAHPTLKGMIESLDFLAMQIDKERSIYNRVVWTYNARLLTFPTNLTSLLVNIEPLPLFLLRGE